MAITGPYGGYAEPGQWAERIIVLDNKGQSPRRLTASCIAERTSFDRTVNVPANTRRMVHVAFRPGNLTTVNPADERVRDRPVACEQSTGLKDERSGTAIPQTLRTTLRLPKNMTHVSVVPGAAVAGDTTRHIGELPGRQFGRVRMMNEQPGSLPDRWYGYSMIDVLFIAGSDPSRLRPSQLAAILQWAGRGGVVVLTGTSELADMLAGPLGRAAGVGAIGLHGVDALDITGDGLDGVRVNLVAALPLVELATHGAEVLYSSGGMPLLTRAKFGHGRVFTLATPLGALVDPSSQRVFQAVAEAMNTAPQLDEDMFLAPAEDTLNQIAGRRSPTATVPLGIMLSLTGLVLVAGLVLRVMRRGELLWLLLLPVVIAVSLGLYIYGSSLTTPQRLSHIGLISGLDGRLARVQQVFAFGSGPQASEIAFTGGNEFALIEDIGAGSDSLQSGQVRTEAMLSLGNRHIEQNATAAFYIDTIGETDGIDSRLSFDDAGLAGQVTNRIGADIEEAVVYVNGQTYAVGRLADGATTEVSVTKDQELAPGEFTGSNVPNPRRNSLLVQLATSPAERSKTARLIVDNQAVLIGYSSTSLINPLDAPDVARQGWSVVVWPLPLLAPEAGTKVRIPAGFVEMKLKTTMWSSRQRRFIPSEYGGTVQISAGPPSSIGSLTDATATITVQIAATNYRLTAFGAEQLPTGVLSPTDEIDSFANPSGTMDITIPRADRFLDKDGRMIFVLKVAKLSQGTGEGDFTLADSATCKFESIHVALEGTVR